jgi:site-specific recombinase XerD
MGEHGIDVRTIAARAGHNKLETTMRYLHTNADLNARAANVFNGLE